MSIGDLFVVKKQTWKAFQRNKMSSRHSSEGFYKAREALGRGDYEGAEVGIGKILPTPEGRFEYVGDLILTFYTRNYEGVLVENRRNLRVENNENIGSGNEVYDSEHRNTDNDKYEDKDNDESNDREYGTSNSTNRNVNDDTYKNIETFYTKDIKNRNISHDRKLKDEYDFGSFGGRSQLFDNLKKLYDSNLYHKYSKDGFCSHGISFLNMNHGLASSQYIVQEKTFENKLDNSSSYVVREIHHRKWFASSVDNVVVGDIRCVLINKSSDRYL